MRSGQGWHHGGPGVLWFYGVMVSTLDFESSNPSSNLGRTSLTCGPFVARPQSPVMGNAILASTIWYPPRSGSPLLSSCGDPWLRPPFYPTGPSMVTCHLFLVCTRTPDLPLSLCPGACGLEDKVWCGGGLTLKPLVLPVCPRGALGPGTRLAPSPEHASPETSR